MLLFSVSKEMIMAESFDVYNPTRKPEPLVLFGTVSLTGRLCSSDYCQALQVITEPLL